MKSSESQWLSDGLWGKRIRLNLPNIIISKEQCVYLPREKGNGASSTIFDEHIPK